MYNLINPGPMWVCIGLDTESFSHSFNCQQQMIDIPTAVSPRGDQDFYSIQRLFIGRSE